jgi:RepB DNA-primase N-terminal domain
MHDTNNRGCFLIPPEEDPRQWNRKGFGVFWTVNEFREGVRRIDHLTRIMAWAIDMDSGTKSEQRARLHKSPLEPSLIVETKRGYQAYWNAKPGASQGHWNAIVLGRLVPFFGSDPNARDLARILRVPGYLHLKDPADPFEVREVHRCEVSYSEEQIARSFKPEPKTEDPQKIHERVKREAKFSGSDDFWDQVYNLDCEEALARLSGHPSVGGEQYSFRTCSNGNRNILVDGKGTSCWVDRSGHIGSLANGGPTIAQWLKWFGLSYADAAKVIKEIFPQLDRKA